MVPVRLTPACRYFSDLPAEVSRMSPGMSHSGCRRLPRRQRRVAPSAFWNAWNNTKNFLLPVVGKIFLGLDSDRISYPCLCVLHSHCVRWSDDCGTGVRGCPLFSRSFPGLCSGYFLLSDNFPISLFLFCSIFWDRNFSAFQRGGRKTHERLGMTNERVRRTTVRITTNRKEGQNARF